MAFTVLVLVLMALCVVSPIAEASRSIVGNRQYQSSKGYRSHTKVSGFYDERGYAYNVFVMAAMYGEEDDMAVVHGSAKATANSPYIRTKKDAYHGYAIGSTTMDIWMNN